MSKLKLSFSGYVCAPYLHTDISSKLKQIWTKSKNIEKLFFVTGTFSSESKPYFDNQSNHYLLAKFKDSVLISNDLSKYNQEKTSFVFNIKDELFHRVVDGDTNFVSVCYMEYDTDGDDFQEIANLFLKKIKIEKAGFGNMVTYCLTRPKFTFPYSESIIVIEVGSKQSHQSMKKYCDQTRRDANRKGLTMTNLLSFSILDKLK
jgi:hypothetical protein